MPNQQRQSTLNKLLHTNSYYAQLTPLQFYSSAKVQDKQLQQFVYPSVHQKSMFYQNH